MLNTCHKYSIYRLHSKNVSLTDKIGVKTELSRFSINSVRHLGFRKKSIFYFNLALVNTVSAKRMETKKKDFFLILSNLLQKYKTNHLNWNYVSFLIVWIALLSFQWYFQNWIKCKMKLNFKNCTLKKSSKVEVSLDVWTFK